MRGLGSLFAWLAAVLAVALSNLMALLLVATALVFWRLAEGPIRLDFLLPELRAALETDLRGADVAFDRLSIVWLRERDLLGLQVDGVRVAGLSGARLGGVERAIVQFSFTDLLRRDLVPTALLVVAPRLTAERDKTGALSLDLGPETIPVPGPVGVPGDLPGLLQRLLTAPGPGDPIGRLTAIGVEDARVSLRDALTGTALTLPSVDARLTRGTDSAILALNVTLPSAAGADPQAAAPGTLSALAELRLSDGSGRLTAQLTGVSPAALSAFDPALAPLAEFDLSLAATLTAQFGPGLTPGPATLSVVGAPGRIAIPSLYPGGLALERLALTATYDPAAGRVNVAALDLWAGPLRVSGDAALTLGEGEATLAATLRAAEISVPNLVRLWPAGLKTNVRDWLRDRVPAGRIRRAELRLAGRVPAPDGIPDLAALDPEIEGTLTAEGVTLLYVPELPPATDVALTALFAGDTITITPRAGRVRDVRVTGGRGVLRLPADADHTIEISVDLDGPLATVLAVLDHEPFRYAQALGVDPAEVAGAARGQVRFAMPLIDPLPKELVEVEGEARLDDVRAAGLADGRTLADGTLAVTLTGEGMAVTGTGEVEGIPAEIAWEESFDETADVIGTTRVSGTVTEDDLARLGYPFLRRYVEGRIPATLVYTERRRGTDTIRITGPARNAILRVPQVNVEKPLGTPADIELELHLPDGDPVAIERLTVSGPTLDADAGFTLGPQGDPTRIDLRRFRSGRTDVTGSLEFARGGAIRARLRGNALDLVPLMAPEPPGDSGAGGRRAARRDGTATEAVPFTATVDLGRVWMTQTGRLDRVVGTVSNDGSGWREIDLAARAGRGALTARFRPRGDGNSWDLLVDAADGGALLSAAGVTSEASGGRLRLEARVSGRGAARVSEGTVRLTNAAVRKAPGLAVLVNALSIQGLAEALAGQGISFERIVARYRMRGEVIEVREGHAAGSGLGLTAAGVIDLGRDRLDLKGTVVPLRVLNEFIGDIPLLGEVLGGLGGEGMFAATYTMTGSTERPRVDVNPLAAFAPGVLRDIFFEGEAASMEE